MVSINEFCDRLMTDFNLYFRDRHQNRSVTQSKSSCREIIKSCVDFEPDYIVELGTNYGLSTLSLVYALSLLGKSPSVLTTIDINHTLWYERTPEIQRGLILNAGLDVCKVRTITSDFLQVKPGEVIKKGKTLIFFDIHDTPTEPFSEKFITEWIPALGTWCVLVHDCIVSPNENWMDINIPIYPIYSAQHFSGITFEGYKECKVFIDWLNATHRDAVAISDTSLLKFGI